MLAWATHTALTHGARLVAEGDYIPYDQGVRHIATIAGYLCYGMMALTVCFGILTTTGWARRQITRPALTSTFIAGNNYPVTAGLGSVCRVNRGRPGCQVMRLHRRLRPSVGECKELADVDDASPPGLRGGRGLQRAWIAGPGSQRGVEGGHGSPSG